ncbi:MAG: DUF4388 domain-containing protein [Myxococcota bacterium]|nr:DUF4388 domain-containing protein [Myxococcota bacterium]
MEPPKKKIHPATDASDSQDEEVDERLDTPFELDESTGDEPEPAFQDGDPVAAALAIAESIAPEMAEHGSAMPDGGTHSDSGSLKQVIDDVEQRLKDSVTPSEHEAQDFPEELDALDIGAELGRPDDGLKTPYSLQPATEDTLDDHPLDARDQNIPEMAASSQAPETESRLPQEMIGLRFEDGDRWHGHLSETTIWQILTACFVDGLSGAVILERADIERHLFFDNGSLIVATSTAREDRLVELLFREGRLGNQAYRQATYTIGLSGRRAGAILVEQGLISSRELFPTVRHHYEYIIFDTFAWREGVWRYDPEAQPKERIILGATTPQLIIEGIRSHARPEDIESKIHEGTRPLAVPDGICPLEDTGLLPEELEIYQAFDGATDIERLAVQFDLGQGELMRLVAGLAALGLVQLKNDKAQAPSAGSVRTPDRASIEPGFRLERARVREKAEQVKEGSYFDLLEVPPGASGHEIRKAYKRLLGRFAFERFVVEELKDLQTEVRLILDVIDEAYEVLRNADLREMYRQSIKERL